MAVRCARAAVGQFEGLVEQRIRIALVDGVFDDLPGKGRPLVIDDDSLVPEDMRQVLVLRVVDGLPSREVAGILDKSDAAVRKSYSRAMARLVARMNDEQRT